MEAAAPAAPAAMAEAAPAPAPAPATARPPELAFIHKILRMSGLLFLVALLISLGFRSLRISLGLAAGTALATLVILYWRWLVRRAFSPGAQRRGKGFLAFTALVKLPAVGAAIWALVTYDLVSIAAFAIGFTIPQLATALLALGARLAAPSREPSPREGEGGTGG